MIELTNRPTLGPYVLTRELPAIRLAGRWLALHEVEQSSHLVYIFSPCRDKAAERRFLSAVDVVRRVEHAHVLPIEHFTFDIGSRPCLVTPYPGDISGILTLDRLLRDKVGSGGRMSGDEAERAVSQILGAIDIAHRAGLQHGPIGLEELFVDRRGRVIIELYGLGRALKGSVRSDPELARDEIRSVVEIGYQLITGLRAEIPLIPAGRLVKRLDRAWEQWLERGLDPSGGFDTADEAVKLLPTHRKAWVEPRQSVLGVKTALGQRRSYPAAP